MAEPALGGEREVQEDCGYAATGDEKRFQTLSTNVGYVSYVLVGAHGGVVRVSFNLPDDEHSEEHAWCIFVSQRGCGGFERED